MSYKNASQLDWELLLNVVLESEGITPDTPPPLFFLRREAPENFLVRKSLIKNFAPDTPPFFSRKNRTRGGGIWSDTFWYWTSFLLNYVLFQSFWGTKEKGIVNSYFYFSWWKKQLQTLIKTIKIYLFAINFFSPWFFTLFSGRDIFFSFSGKYSSFLF